MAWAFAMAGQSDAPLFVALARASEWHVDNLQLQNLANISWAFATAGRSDASLLAALAKAAELRVGNFKPQGLAIMAFLRP